MTLPGIGVRAVLALGVALSVTGCGVLSNRTGPASSAQGAHWVADGSISINRPLPTVMVGSLLTEEQWESSALAFAPSSATSNRSWLRVSRKEGKIRLLRGSDVLFEVSGEGFTNLPTGSYSLLHKQRDAAWYAPDSYFETRDFEVPPAQSKDRYLRGALGEFALFLDPEIPLHCGPLWLEDIGGAKLTEQDISRLYYNLEVGAQVVVE